nr:galectin-10-like [Pelodiscus sinensis]|eukprot:XP_025045400.1 galectin-10-like [Pelodiscus sinensis]
MASAQPPAGAKGGRGKGLDFTPPPHTFPHHWAQAGSVAPKAAPSRKPWLSRCRLHSSFQVKFLRGQYKEANVALLFSHCFQGSSHILLNSLVEKKWGQEQREDNSPLCKGGSFTLMFTITDKEYQVTVNEHHYFEFQHRLPPEDVHYLEVHGEVQLEAVSWGEGCCDRSCLTEGACPGAPRMSVKMLRMQTGGDQCGQSTSPRDENSPIDLARATWRFGRVNGVAQDSARVELNS